MTSGGTEPGANAGGEGGGAVARPAGAAPARRFSDEEVARILRAAAEMQERSDAPGSGPRGGLSLEDLRQVAREVGIDPRFVEVAADRLHAPPDREGNALAGGAYAWTFHRTVEGEVPEGSRDRIVQAIRAAVGQKGEVEDVYGRMEWSYDDGLGPIIVGLVSRGGRTEIDVSARRASEVGLYHGLGTTFLGGAGGAAAAAGLGIAGLLGPAGVIPVMAGGILVAYAGLRTLWGTLSRRWEWKLERLADAAAAAAGEVAVAPGGDEALPAAAGEGARAPEAGGAPGSPEAGPPSSGGPPAPSEI